jgi:hypothetical protein
VLAASEEASLTVSAVSLEEHAKTIDTAARTKAA